MPKQAKGKNSRVVCVQNDSIRGRPTHTVIGFGQIMGFKVQKGSTDTHEKQGQEYCKEPPESLSHGFSSEHVGPATGYRGGSFDVGVEG